jgi:hypothetical protein
MNRYPTEDELKKIEVWPNDYPILMEFIHYRWEYANCGYWRKTGKKYWLSTGGRPGNEDIIQAMEKNFMFWNLCWVQSRRGGHYIFEVKKV